MGPGTSIEDYIDPLDVFVDENFGLEKDCCQALVLRGREWLQASEVEQPVLGCLAPTALQPTCGAMYQVFIQLR